MLHGRGFRQAPKAFLNGHRISVVDNEDAITAVAKAIEYGVGKSSAAALSLASIFWLPLQLHMNMWRFAVMKVIRLVVGGLTLN